MNTDDLATNVQQQAPEPAALSKEGRKQLRREIKQLNSRIGSTSKTIRNLEGRVDDARNRLADVRMAIQEGDECLRCLNKEDDTLDFHKVCSLLKREIKDLTSCTDKSQAITAIEDFLAKQVEIRNATQSNLDQQSDLLAAAEDECKNLEAQVAQKQALLRTPVTLGDKVTKGIASGLEYFKEERIIRFKLNGVPVELLSDGKIPRIISKLEIFDALDDAWEIFNGRDNNVMLAKDAEFIENLSLKVKRLDKNCMAMGWEPLKVNVDFGDEVVKDKGEMFLQQFVYPHYASLFLAAANADNLLERRYKTDQKVTGSLSFLTYQSTVDSSPVVTKLSIQPDVAVTLGAKAWDAFGMMELKPHGPDPSTADTLRCVLMTAITALAINKVVTSAEDRKRIAIPFILGEGLTCSLFVTTLDDEGIPRIKVVKYPGTDTTARDVDISNLSSIDRKYLFVALAVLLNNINTLFNDAERRDVYKKQLANRIELFEHIPSEIIKKKTSDAGSDSRNVGSNAGQGVGRNRQTGSSNQQSIQEAQDAASLGGTFTSVECAFERRLFILSWNMSSSNDSSSDDSSSDDSSSDDVTDSPFYFKGRMTSSKIASTTSKDVFLKVWNEERAGVLGVEMEWTHYKIALDAGVPVAAPVLPEIVRATSSSGIDHLVFAVEYIHEDAIRTIDDIVQFSESLIQSVMKLHDAAGLLHCDLKPANVRWSKGVVSLIDFGHAQPINLAVWVPGTRGYQAPEIVDRMPCSVMTDAFSVGRTIIETLETFCNDGNQENDTYVILLDIACRLCDPMVDSRWPLQQALCEIHDKILKVATELEMQEPLSPIIVEKVSQTLPLVQTLDMSQEWNAMPSLSKENESGKKIAHSVGSQVASHAPSWADMDCALPSGLFEDSENQNSRNVRIPTQRLRSNIDGNLPQKIASSIIKGKETAAPAIDKAVEISSEPPSMAPLGSKKGKRERNA